MGKLTLWIFMKTIPTKNPLACLNFLALALILISTSALAQDRPMGTDVSSFQGSNLNWVTIKNDGIFFAWTKATEGPTGYYYDADFVTNEVKAKAAGVLIGAYHYAHPSLDTNITGANSADTEAQYFWSKASNYVVAGGSYLVPMLDWEDPAVSSPNQTVTSMSAWANEWCSDISNYARAQGVILRPVIYTGESYGATWLNSSVTIWPNWIAAYPYGNSTTGYGDPRPQVDSPGGYSPWPTWDMWQYGDTNWSGGDSDVFNGTTNQFLSLFLVGSTNAPHITTNLISMTVAQGSNVTLSLSVSGGTPLYYRWLFDGTNVGSVTNYNTNSVQYVLPNVQLTDAGAYSVQISNANGNVVSPTAFLSVTAPLSNAPGSVLAPSGLVNWWPANGNAIDIVSGNNALPSGNFFYSSGNTGQAFHFDGATAYLAVTNIPADLTGSWTACMWVNRQQTSQTSAALLSDGTYTLKLEQYNNTHEVGITQAGVKDWVFTNSSYTVPLNTWTHLAFVGIGSGTSGTITLYVNGAKEGLLNTNLALGRTTLGATYATGTGYVDYMLGSLDEIMLFNKALTATQIQSIYNAGSASLIQAPQFTGMAPDGNGNYVFSLEGLTGSRNFTVYYSTNLPQWSVLTTLSAANGTNQFTVNPTNGAAFFYAIQP
jgi:GH25 family lysozyme M1 (1,4-beta-N-acetylmuramidase)